MNSGGHDPSKFELYCDGLLPPSEARAFEEQLARDPQLRAAVDAQRRIDSSIHRTSVAPRANHHPPQSLAVASTPSAPASSPSPFSLAGVRRSRWLAVAAMLIISLPAWRVWNICSRDEKPTDEYVGG